MNNNHIPEVELESILGGGAIFDAGMEMAASGKAGATDSGTALGASIGAAEMVVGGWALIVGGVLDLIW